MQALSRAFSKDNATLPTPIETHVTRWGNDPLARGAYSYYATGNAKYITGENEGLGIVQHLKFRC